MKKFLRSILELPRRPNSFPWPLLGGVVFFCTACAVNMPGKSYNGPLDALGPEDIRLKEDLERHVRFLAETIGERNIDKYENLLKAADYLEKNLESSGYEVARQEYEVEEESYYNIEAGIRGTIKPDEIIVVGAHYDSVQGSPGANDNASGTASVLALAETFSGKPLERTLRFVLFTNEEPPFFYEEDMGSRVYAKRSRERGEDIVAMISLETMGYFSDEEGSQEYPRPLDYFYPSRGNFIAFVGNISSRGLVKKSIGAFREAVNFPSSGGALPGNIDGVYWSDHWSFWKEGYKAIMVTDTALFRYPHYHTRNDTPDRINFDHLARVVRGVESVITELANDGKK